MDENNELRIRLCAVGMELFRRDGLRFTMQQAAAVMHISKKDDLRGLSLQGSALLLDMVDDAFTRIHARKQRILTAPAPLQKSCGRSLSPCRRSTPRWICSRWICWMINIPRSRRVCVSIWKPAGSLP